MKKLFPVFIFFSSWLYAQETKFDAEWINEPKKFVNEIENAFDTELTGVYVIAPSSNSIILENGYAQSELKNPALWKPLGTGFKVDTISLIYTQYPKDKNFWLTDYHLLLAQRLKVLFTLDPSLNNENIHYKIILQTACNSDKEARTFFHGVSITYSEIKKAEEVIKSDSVKNENTLQPIVSEIKKAEPSAESKKISNFINSNGGMLDSTVFNVLNRHPEWNKCLVIMDWTGSMYPYGGQAVLWHSLNFNKSGLKYFVFFNDGDNDTRKKIGRTGGIYFEKAENLKKIVNMLNRVKMKGNGGDTEENNLEAIIKGIQKYPDFNNVILIADNNSCMRDYCLLNEITVPVKVILCGTYTGINPQFLNLAYKTKGSIHTIENDIYDLYTHSKSDATFMIDGNEYHFNSKRDIFEYNQKVDKDDPHFCDPFYKKKKCKCEKIKL